MVKSSFNDSQTMKYLGAKIPDELDERILATGRPKSDVVRDALAAYFSIESAPQNKEDLIALIDERIRGKTGVKSKLNKGKTDVKPILEAIRYYHDRGMEPLVSEVAQRSRMKTRPMGVLLKGHGIEAKSTRRDGKAGRYFTFDLSEKIDDLLG